MTFLRNSAYIFGLTIFAPVSVPLSAIPRTSTWIAESPEHDINTPENWSPPGVPAGVVQVIFDSSVENVDLSPTQSNDNFSVCSIYFPNSASLFTIHFNDYEVGLNGLGITGLQTNATINATNTNNPSILSNQFSLNRNNNSSSGSAALNITNTGSQLLNSSSVTLGNMDNQFFVQGPFSMLNGGSLTLTNIGSDSSHGTGGNQISFMTAYQSLFNNTTSIEDNITISLSNSGTYSGSNNMTGNTIGSVLNGQYYNAEAFFAGDTFDFSVTNNGVNSGTSEGSSSIGVIGSSQISFGFACNLGDYNTIVISNNGENTGNSGTNNSNILYVGTIYEHQLYVNTQFVAGDDFSLTATNIGIDSGSGSGQTYVGTITSNSSDGDQVMFNNSCTVGDHAAFVVENSGTCSELKTGAITNVGQLGSNQMTFNGEFQADNFLNFSVTNSGTDSSQSINNNSIGVVSSCQLLFNSSAIIQDNATISISNLGNFSGNTANIRNYASAVGLQQFTTVGHFEAGDSFDLQIENIGEDTGSGAGSNLIGAVGRQQVYFQDSCTLGDDAIIEISNTGINSNESTANQTGYVNLSQLEVDGNFIAGANLNISITNSATNTGNETNYIGYVSGSQALFNGSVTLGDGSIISVTNNGTVEGTQISFNEGFTISSGKITIQAINEGINISDIGFFIQGANSGGNANIVLENVMLDIETTLSSFTIGELNGDSLSTVKSIPSLIINTDSSTNGLFSGIIQDHSDIPLILTKQGLGKQTLSGINTYTGGTIVSNGFLNIQNSSGLGTEAVSIASGAQLQVQGGIAVSNSLTLNGVGDNTGALLNISGNNAYSGAIALGAATTIGSTAGTLTLSHPNTISGTHNLIFTGAGNTTVSGIIATSSGTLTKNGSGTLILSGVNTYSGGTIINEGTLSVSSANNIGGSSTALSLGGGTMHATGNVTTSGAVSVVDDSTISTDASAVTTLSGILTGSNGKMLTLSGSGTNSLAEVTVNGSDSFTITGIIGGMQMLTKSGTGTLTLTNANTYLGGTTIENGVVNLSTRESSLGSASVNMTEDTTLQCEVDGIEISNSFSLSSSNHFIISTGTTTISGIIGGSGTLNKEGSGTLLLTEVNPYAGTITVHEGRLTVNGSIANSALNLEAGTTLKGSGIIGSLSIHSGATLAPGNSIGTINSGPATFSAGSIFSVEIDPSSSSLLSVTGAASIAGSVDVVANAGSYAKSGEYRILQADSLTGAFDPFVLGGLNGYTFSLSQMGNAVYLLYRINPIDTSGLSGNALKLADYLNQNADRSTLTLLNDLSESSLKNALNSVSPARNAFGTYIATQTAFSLNNVVSTHIDGLRFFGHDSSQDRFLSTLTADSSDGIKQPVSDKKSKNKFSAWISGFGGFSHQSASLQNPSFNFISGAALIGLDYKGENKRLMGGSLGYAHTHYYENNHAGHGDINYYFSSLYANGFIGDFYFSPVVSGIFNKTDNTRSITFQDYSENAHANIFAWQFIPHLEAGYDAKFSWGDIVPFTSADWAISWQRGYSEQGASPFNAKQKRNNCSMVRSETGLKLCEKWERSWGEFLLKEKISYIFEKSFGIGVVNTAFAGTPGIFTVTAVNQNLNLGSVGFNFLLAIGKKKPLKLDFGYEGDFGSNYWSNELMFRISKGF